ncbi:hypothetical protein CsatB_011143 [Cannabis sativa]
MLYTEEEYEKKNEQADQKSILVESEETIFSKYDNLFVDIQNQLDGKNFITKSANLINRIRPVEEITYAKNILKQCLDIDLDNVIQLGRDFELMKSLSILLSSNAFPEEMVDEITKFVANFIQSCEQYELAKKDLREVQLNEKKIDDLKTDMKQIYSDFLPIRTQGEAVDHEITVLERQLTERKTKKARLSKMLEDLAGRAATSKQALVTAEQDQVIKVCVLKKEQAEKVICDVKKSWESLKLGYANMVL